jgi:hypothetical protein
MGRPMEFESPGEAVRYIKSIMPLPEPFERILLEYGMGGGNWDFNWVEDPVLRHLVKECSSTLPPVKEVVLTPSYLVFIHKRDAGNSPPYVMLVFGLTEEGRLFLNVLENHEGIAKKKPICNIANTNVYTTSDSMVTRLLGFERFAPEGYTLSIPANQSGASFRLQSDIVADLLPPVGRMPKDLGPKEFLYKLFETRIRNYLTLCLLDIIYAALLEHGFSITPVGPPGPPQALAVVGISSNDFLKNKPVFESILQKYFQTTRITHKQRREYDEVLILSNDFGLFSVRFLPDIMWFEDSLLEISVRPIKVDDFPMAMRLKKELGDTLAAMEKMPETSFRIGNHLITLTNFMSSTITFRPSYKPTFLDWPIEVSLVDMPEFHFVSLPNARITLKHREHGTKTVYVEPYLALRLRTTNTSGSFVIQRNRAVLNALAERLMAENKETGQNSNWLNKTWSVLSKAKKALWRG